MRDDDSRVWLEMDVDEMRTLRRRARETLGRPGAWDAVEVLSAMSEAELHPELFGVWRVPCTEQALTFISTYAPVVPIEIKAPGVSRSDVLALIGVQAAGKKIVGLEVDRDRVARLVLDGGAAIVFAPDGQLDYVEGFSSC